VLVLVADSGKIPGLFAGSEDRLRWAHATAGAIAQNVYLMGTARGVGTCLVAGIDEGAIRKGLNLSNTAIPLYVMPLGTRRNREGGFMKKRRFVDLSIAIEPGLPSDPPMMIPKIDYVGHEQGAEQMKDFFPA